MSSTAWTATSTPSTLWGNIGDTYYILSEAEDIITMEDDSPIVSEFLDGQAASYISDWLNPTTSFYLMSEAGERLLTEAGELLLGSRSGITQSAWQTGGTESTSWNNVSGQSTGWINPVTLIYLMSEDGQYLTAESGEKLQGGIQP